MKSRTLLSGFLSATNQFWLAILLVILRISLGGLLLAGALQVLIDFDVPANVIAPVAAEFIFAVIFACVGIVFILGLLMRPFAILGAGAFIVMCIFQGFQEPICFGRCLFFTASILLGTAGGWGHILGFDSLIHSVFQKNKLARFFFA